MEEWDQVIGPKMGNRIRPVFLLPRTLNDSRTRTFKSLKVKVLDAFRLNFSSKWT